MQPTYRDQPIPGTSLATRSRHPNEVTVRFSRWCQVGLTAYQKGQCAGFLRGDALKMAQKGMCEILPMRDYVPPGAPAESQHGRKAAQGAAA